MLAGQGKHAEDTADTNLAVDMYTRTTYQYYDTAGAFNYAGSQQYRAQSFDAGDQGVVNTIQGITFSLPTTADLVIFAVEVQNPAPMLLLGLEFVYTGYL